MLVHISGHFLKQGTWYEILTYKQKVSHELKFIFLLFLQVIPTPFFSCWHMTFHNSSYLS